MIKLFYVKDNYIVPQESQVPVRWEDIHGDISGNTQLQEVINDLQNDINTNAQAIADEIQSRIDGDTNLQNQIDDNRTAIEQEETDRKDADKTLQDAIDLEQTAREEADAMLQGNINTESALRSNADQYISGIVDSNKADIEGKLTNEATAREIADNYISGIVDSNKADIEGKLSDEADARRLADDALHNDLSTEVQVRSEADTSLRNDLTEEITRAKAAETSNKNSIDAEVLRATTKESELEDAITKEIADRKDADRTLQSNIDIEVARATEADNAHQVAIQTETTNRITADSHLQEQISANETALHNLIKNDTIQDNRLDALENASTTVNDNIATINAKNAEQDLSIQTLQSNIDAEATRATNAETTLQTAISTETSNRETADSTLNDKITKEIADRKDADNVLQDNIDAEELARQTADSTLNDKITATNSNISENYYKKTEVDSKIDKIVAGDTSLQNYYTKAESDTNYQPKGNYALSGSSYTKAESDNKYALKGDVPTDVYTKEQVDNKLSNKADKSEIPTIPLFRTINGQAITGDTTNITIEGGSGADLTNYYTKAEADNKYALKGDVPTDVYTKLEVDSKLSDKLDVSAYTPTDLTDYAKTEDVNIELTKKLDVSAYTPYDDTEIRQAISNKQDKGNYVSTTTLNYYYRKAEVDNKLIGKQDTLVSGQNIKTINGQSIVGNGNIIIENDTDLSDYYTKTQVDNKLSDKLDVAAYTRVIVDTELSSASTNPVQNKAIAVKLAELQSQIDELKDKPSDVLKVTFMSVNDKGIEVKPTYTVTYNNTTITTSNSEMYVAKDVTMTVVPSDIDGLVTPVAQTKKITEDTTFNFEYNGEALPVGTGRISFRTTSDNYVVNVANDSSKLTSMIIDNVSIPLESSGPTNYTFANAGLHTGTYALKQDEINGYQGAFTNCDELEEVTVPEGVTALTSAFSGCTNLKTVSLPDTLVTIGNNEFKDCENLTGVTIPDNVTSIGNNAFQNCSYLKNVNFGEHIETIGDYAFEKCWQLRKVELKDNVKTIGNYAFNACPSITGITIGSACESIGSSVFCGSSSAQYVKMNGANVPTIGYNLFIYKINPSTSALADLYPIYVPNGAESGYKSSWGSDYSDRIKSVADMPTYSEPTAEDITYIKTVDSSGKTMEFDAYFVGEVDSTMIYGFHNGANSISEVKFSNKVTNLLAGVLQSFQKITSVGGSGSGSDVEIPDTVTIIPDNAFYYCQNITRVIIPDWVTGLGVKAFSNCVSLTNLTIGKNLTVICNECFRYCSNIEGAIEFPTTEPIAIGNKAFANCNKVTSYTFNGPVTAYDNAFQQSGSTVSLESITFNNGLVSAGQSILWGCTYCSTIILRNQEAAIQTSVASPSTIWGSTTASKTVGYKVSGDKFVYLNSDSTLTESDIDRSNNLFSASYSNFKLSKTL